MSHLLILRAAQRPLARLTLGLFVLLCSSACASRTAPFDKLDKASITILKLQAQAPQAAPASPLGSLIPGLPRDLQQLGLQALQQMQAQGLIPPGLIPPGLIPGLGGAAQPQPPAAPLFRNQWAIADQRAVMDTATRDKLLDLFGSAASFNNQRYGCFSPTMAVSFQSPELPEPIDVVVSLPCNQVAGYGLQWPHPGVGLSGESHATLTGIYANMFGPVPPAAPGTAALGTAAPGPVAPTPGYPAPAAPGYPAAPAMPAAPAAPAAPAPPAMPAPGAPY
jgi:hypothetical protein